MKYYFIGIKGSGMSTLANLLYDLGNSIVGYDDSDGYKFTLEGLNKRGIPIHHGTDYPKLEKDTIVTYTAAINESHHEVKRVKELGYQIMPYEELIGNITASKESICVCGTHGKTTTSLMISSILDKALGCSYFVGDGSGHGTQDSNLLVIESCEYNRHFLKYHPFNTIITNIELDHTETYPTLENMIEAYQVFVEKTKNSIIACGDDENVLKLTSTLPIYYYGFKSNNVLIAKNKETKNEKTYFDVYYQNEFFDHYEVPFFGEHMILDSLAAIMTGILYDVSKEIIKSCLESFKPALRRFNETKVLDNIVVDDYAHHPTEIKVTYNSAHEKYPDKKIIGIFLPNTYSRTEALFDDFATSLSLFDKVYLMEISCDRESQSDYEMVSSERLIEKIPNSEMLSLETVQKLLEYDNVVLCFMSCANISPVVKKYLELKQK